MIETRLFFFFFFSTHLTEKLFETYILWQIMVNKNDELQQQYCNYIVQVSWNKVFDGKQTDRIG